MALAPAYPTERDWLGKMPPAFTADTGATLDLDFVGATRLPSYVTFTRANATATRVNSAGQIVMCAANEPRFTHDLLTRAPKGLLIEGARTNLLVNSVLAGGTTPTGWTLTGASAVASSIYGNGDGAVALTFTSAADQNYITRAVTLASNTTYSVSVFIEAVTGTVANNNVALATSLPAGCTITTWYANGVASTSGAACVVGTLTLIIGGTYTGAATNFNFGCGTTGAATGSVTISRTTVEAGTFRSSFIPTTTGTVARSADSCTITGAAAAAIIGATTGTMFCEFDEISLGSLGGARCALALDDGSANNRHRIAMASGAPLGQTTNGGVSQASITVGSAVVANTVTRFAYRYATNSCHSYRDGTAGTEDTAATMPTVNRVQFGQSAAAADHLFGHIRRVLLFNTSLSDVAMARVTDSAKVSERALVSGLWNTGATAGVMMPAHWAGSPL